MWSCVFFFFFAGPKINASEGINRREKKAWTLGGQDCFVFPKAISLFTRRLLFQKNTGPVTLPRSVGAQQSREHSRQTWFGKGAYLLPLKERREERNLHCSAISALSTGFEHAPVWQQKAASTYLRWQRSPSTVAVSLACCLGRGQCCCSSAAEEAGKERTCITCRVPAVRPGFFKVLCIFQKSLVDVALFLCWCCTSTLS